MRMPWPAIRAAAERVNARVDREMHGGAAVVGPAVAAPPAVNSTNDEENQDVFATSDQDGFQAPKFSELEVTSAAIDRGPAVDVDKEKQISIFTVLKIVTVLSALYMAADPWIYLYYAGDGFNMCSQMVLCTSSLTEMILLTGSRLSAGVLFSSLSISIISKCYSTRSCLHNSWFGTVVDFEPSHDIHTYFGYLSLMAGFEHAILHSIRFAYGGKAYIIHQTDTGRSGVIGVLLLLPIVLPMKFEFLRTKMSFQFRKSLHMLFLPLMVALCFHSVVFRYVGTILVVWYTLDRVYFTTKQTFLIDHPVFEAVGRGTMVTIDLPTGYTFKAGSYIYVNSPMINRNEWHPFSIIQLPGSVPKAIFYAEAVGDWTKELFHLGLEQPRLPLWITAAQPSLMEKSIYYDNVVLVCTGAGITPAVSIIERFAKRKNIHLLWMTRDCGMVALFEKQLRKVNTTVHLTGSPPEDTKTALRSLLRPAALNAPVTPKMSFRNIVAGCPHLTRPPRMPRHARSGEDGPVHMGATAYDDEDDTNALPAMVLPERLNRSRSSTTHHRMHRQSSFKVKAADPVKLEFGRPHICVYLRGTFAMERGSCGTKYATDLDSASVRSEISVSARDTGRSVGLPGREASYRLDLEQKVSKVNLMKADASFVEACQLQRIQRALTKGSANGTPATASRPGSTRRWLVLYCGANVKVEQAIATTCDELHVNWQKEYFGAW